MNVDLLDVAKLCIAILMVAATLGFAALVLSSIWQTIRGKK